MATATTNKTSKSDPNSRGKWNLDPTSVRAVPSSVDTALQTQIDALKGTNLPASVKAAAIAALQSSAPGKPITFGLCRSSDAGVPDCVEISNGVSRPKMISINIFRSLVREDVAAAGRAFLDTATGK
ncbi:hypothetical protein [Planctomicrobium piriforme]|uniref:Uncharacterized protein n=1 Tax=Planctomicrobium piriforme TaxID=1576369 RepID=A0A1I3EEV1_9PLAN|nr:hypothetical protein [Planctomicrobium piriforme]SFH97469.1 hypothetical protein SAMN05421753_104192 [Planctomicrobium piriforme]